MVLMVFIYLSIIILFSKLSYNIYHPLFRDAPEATGDEPEDADFETPKVYEVVRTHQCLYQRFSAFFSRRLEVLNDLDTTYSFRKHCQLTVATSSVF